MKLSIITCTYNSEKYLQQTINSIINQKLDNNLFEHIFIDWNSSDNTVEIIEKYINENKDKQIKLIIKEPKWIYNAMNEWIINAKWKYILFLHSDDYLEHNILKDYLDFIEQTWNLDLYYAKFNAVNQDWKFIYNAPNRKFYQKWLKKWLFWLICYINQPTVLHKKTMFEKYWYFNENYKNSSDYEFYIKLAQNMCSSLFFDKTVTNFRYHENSASTWKWNDIWTIENIKILNKYYWIERHFYIFINYLYRKLTKKS